MDDKKLTALRDAAQTALRTWEDALKAELADTPQGREHDHLQASITQVGSAKRVLWMDS